MLPGQVELQDWSDEVSEHIAVEHGFGLAVVADHSLALPRFTHLSDLRRVSPELNHDAHLGIQDYCVGDHSEHELLLFFFFFLFRACSQTTSRRCVFVCSNFGLLLVVFLLRLDLPDPTDPHLLATSVLQKELLGHNLMCVLSSKIDVAQVLLAEQR